MLRPWYSHHFTLQPCFFCILSSKWVNCLLFYVWLTLHINTVFSSLFLTIFFISYMAYLLQDIEFSILIRISKLSFLLVYPINFKCLFPILSKDVLLVFIFLKTPLLLTHSVHWMLNFFLFNHIYVPSNTQCIREESIPKTLLYKRIGIT